MASGVDGRRRTRLESLEEPWSVLVCGFGGADNVQADDESSGPRGDDEWPGAGGGNESPGPEPDDELAASDGDDQSAGGPLEGLRGWVAERLSEYGVTPPEVRSAADLPEYVRFVATREGRAYSGKVPARTVFQLDGYS
jgi:hypothetical protein